MTGKGTRPRPGQGLPGEKGGAPDVRALHGKSAKVQKSFEGHTEATFHDRLLTSPRSGSRAARAPTRAGSGRLRPRTRGAPTPRTPSPWTSLTSRSLGPP